MPSTMPVLPPNDNGCPDDLTNTAGRSLLCNAKRTSDIAPLRSELCQEQTSCTAQKQLFDHLVGAGQERFRDHPAARFYRMAMALRANIRSIFAAMMKSFSCSPLIFFVCKETVALPQPKQMSGGIPPRQGVQVLLTSAAVM